jgi:microcystin-dependent protein
MNDRFIGEIQIFGFGFTPANWALCDGQELTIKDHPDLFSLIGTTYGGDGKHKFRVPNLAGRAVCGQGAGPQLTPRQQGDTFGANSVGLDAAQVPDHNHGLNVFAPRVDTAKVNVPAAGYYLGVPDGAQIFAPDTSATTTVEMTLTATSAADGSTRHENRQPLLALGFYIALRGEIPSFS